MENWDGLVLGSTDELCSRVLPHGLCLVGIALQRANKVNQPGKFTVDCHLLLLDSNAACLGEKGASIQGHLLSNCVLVVCKSVVGNTYQRKTMSQLGVISCISGMFLDNWSFTCFFFSFFSPLLSPQLNLLLGPTLAHSPSLPKMACFKASC